LIPIACRKTAEAVSEIALFPILLFFRFAFRFGHVESSHRSTLREILKFNLTHYTISCPSEGEARERLQGGNFCRIIRHLGSGIQRWQAPLTTLRTRPRAGAFRSRCQHHRKRESRQHVTG
jgi:hypothetical protein